MKRRTAKRKRMAVKEDSENDHEVKRIKLDVAPKPKYGYVGPEKEEFCHGISYYLPNNALNSLVRELKAKPAGLSMKPRIFQYFDASGVGKTSLFREAARQANAYFFSVNTSVAGPFAKIQYYAYSSIRKLFEKDNNVEAAIALFNMHDIFSRAFSLMLMEIIDCLKTSPNEMHHIIMKNELTELDLEQKSLQSPQELLKNIIELLNGKPAVILNDNTECFASRLRSIDYNSIPTYAYEDYAEKEDSLSWKDLMIVAFYRQIIPLSFIGQQHRIMFCQAGSAHIDCVDDIMTALYPIEQHLPLKLFGMNECKELFDHYWHFNITETQKEQLLERLIGLPKLMQYFFMKIDEIVKPPDQVTILDLQLAVDGAILLLEDTIRPRVSKGYCQYYKKLVLDPTGLGGTIEGHVIYYRYGTQGYKTLQYMDTYFSDPPIMRWYRYGIHYILELPSPAVQTVMNRILSDINTD